MLFVGQKHDLDVRVAGAREVLGGKRVRVVDLENERRRREVVGQREVDATQFVVGFLGAPFRATGRLGAHYVTGRAFPSTAIRLVDRGLEPKIIII